jgi:hypothetical protein
MNVTLLGELGGHARGKALAQALGASPGDLPVTGVALGFARQAQREGDALAAWLRWCEQPGRLLVLVPPFERGPTSVPTTWEARQLEPLAGGESELGKLLASERQHELRGELVPLERVGGRMITGGWRRHPAAGLFVVTALPLWSLAVLDHKATAGAWLSGLYAQAGKPRTEDLAPQTSAHRPGLEPGPDDWAILLHLCSGPFESADAALLALARSSLFRLEPDHAREALARVCGAGFAAGGELTPPGEELLAASPYALQARTIRRMRHA